MGQGRVDRDQPEEEQAPANDYILQSTGSELIGAPVGVATRAAEIGGIAIAPEDLSPGEAIMPEEGEEEEEAEEAGADEEI